MLFKGVEIYHRAAYQEMMRCIRRRRLYTRVILMMAFVLMMLGAFASFLKQDYETAVILLLVSLPLPLFEMRLYFWALSLNFVYREDRSEETSELIFYDDGLLEIQALQDRYILYEDINELYESRHYLFIIYQDSQYIMMVKEGHHKKLMAFLRERKQKDQTN